MLGIRRFQGVAIDLWVGNAKEFACDHLCEVEGWQQGLAFCVKNKLRHLCLVIPSSQSERRGSVFHALKACLSGNSHPKRITFILPSAEVYERWQEELFRVFHALDG